MTARTASGRSAAAIRAAAAPVLAPKSAMAPGAAGCARAQSIAATDAAAQQRDIEAMLTRQSVDRGFGRTQEVEQERAEAGGLERAGDGAVAGAETAAAAAVCEHDQPGSRGRDAELGLELDALLGRNADGATERWRRSRSADVMPRCQTRGAARRHDSRQPRESEGDPAILMKAEPCPAGGGPLGGRR